MFFSLPFIMFLFVFELSGNFNPHFKAQN